MGVGFAEDEAGAGFHEEEGRAEDGGIFAEGEGPGRQGEVGIDGGEDAEFAGHIVGFGGDGAVGGPAEDELAAVGGGEFVGEVGVAAGELADGDGGELEPGGEGVDGELFAGADGGGAGLHRCYRVISWGIHVCTTLFIGGGAAVFDGRGGD